MQKIISWLLKALAAGLVAFTSLTVFCFLYYNVPVHQETIDGATDYAWEYSKFYSKATEGFAYGKTNNEGYLNTFDYTEEQEIAILVMGSSHMEAYQVSLQESTAALLNQLFPGDTVYNIGVSGHDFLVCADNLSAAVSKYKPTKYVLLETSTLSFSDEQLASAINETVADIPSHSGGIIGMLQKNPFLRLCYSQLQSFAKNTKVQGTTESNTTTAPVKNLALYDELLMRLVNTVSKTGAQLIIVYHSNLKLNEDGGVICTGDPELTSAFSGLCEKNGILFLDMSNHFVRHYEETHILPHGFSNSSVGSGHLNKHGHKVIAYAIYNLIKENM